MSNFSLNSDLNFNYRALAKLFENSYLDVARLVYTGMSFNSELDDELFLNNYFTQVFARYYTILKYFGAFNSRVEVQRFVDTVVSVIAATMEYFYRTNVDEAIRFFINQFLKVVYDSTEFSVINIKLNSSTQRHTYKIIIEPIAVYKENLCNSNGVEQFCELVTALLSYTESLDRCVSVGVIKSDLWSDYSGAFPEIIDDNVFPKLFENYPAIYKVLFKSRYHLLSEMGVDTADLSEEINLDEETEQIYSSVLESSSSQEYGGTVSAEMELAEYSRIITDLYNKNTGGSRVAVVRIDDVNLGAPVDTPVYADVVDHLERGEFNTWTIQQLVKYYYPSGATSGSNYPEEPPAGVENIKLTDLLNILNSTDASVEFKIDDGSAASKGIKDEVKFTLLESSSDPETRKAPRVEKTEGGYQKFIPDGHSLDEIKLIYDLKDYIESTLSIYISSRGKINAPVLKKVIKSYNNDTVEVVGVNANKSHYIAEVRDSRENTLRFTISKKSGKIECIEDKKK